MKARKIIFALCFLSGIALTCLAQSMNEIFDPGVPVTWLGLDFSNAKFIGDREKYGSLSDVRFLIKSWNDLIEAEKDKYDVSKPFKKQKVDNRLDITRDHNEEVEVEQMLTSDPSMYDHMRQDDVTAIVKSYDFKGLRGTGLMFNVESFSKPAQKAAVWITLIDLDSKTILFTERMEGPPGGSGVRNYWAGSIVDILKKIEKKEFELWRKKYAR